MYSSTHGRRERVEKDDSELPTYSTYNITGSQHRLWEATNGKQLKHLKQLYSVLLDVHALYMNGIIGMMNMCV
jgi:hypothetical protein